jgi:hypothetical protein
MRALTLRPSGLPSLALLALLALGIASPSPGQELPSSDPRVRAAQRYQTSTWVKPGPSVSGWSPDAFKVQGWDRLRVKVDARRAEARVDFALTPKIKQTKPQVAARLRIRRHATQEAARDHFLAHLAACTQTLEREEGLAEVAFGTRSGGRLVYLAGTRGDLSYELRAEGKADLQPLAAALDAQLRLASKPREVPPAPLATLSTSKAQPTAPGKPAAMDLEFKGTVRSLVFQAPEGVSVLRTKTGCVVYSERPGLVEFELLVVDKELRTSRHALRVTTR